MITNLLDSQSFLLAEGLIAYGESASPDSP
jgi:hypothetical protein